MSEIHTRYMVLSDGETFAPLAGSKIVEVADTLEGDEIDAAISARCRTDDDEQGAGVTVLYPFRGSEPAGMGPTGLAEAVGGIPLARPTRDDLQTTVRSLDWLSTVIGEQDRADLQRPIRLARAFTQATLEAS